MQENHPPARWMKPIAIGLLLVVLGIVAGAFISRDMTPTVSPGSGKSAQLSQLQPPRALQPFRLEYDGRTLLGNDDLRGKWTFLFFGYTHCPDICPTTLSELARAYALLEQDPGELDDAQFIFISVDPARDTPDMLASYAGYFNPAFLGVTGEPGQIATLARQMGIQYRRGAGSDEAYTVDHSSAVLLIDPQVRYYARLKAPHHAQDIRAQFLEIRRTYDDLPS